MQRPPRKPRDHTITTSDLLEKIAKEQGGNIERGNGWRTLNLGNGIKLCAREQVTR